MKAAREEKGMSQRALSEAVGVHPMTIHRFESGERLLDVLELVDIARALEIDPVTLFRLALGD
ncbi:XRE family transcriptional regulator [bacterium]|nr:MAG: XRE family transcriptional regulator [bacterium]